MMLYTITILCTQSPHTITTHNHHTQSPHRDSDASRNLCVARISVVRGEGPLVNTPAIDDYIRMVEPVADYLTKYSGLV